MIVQRSDFGGDDGLPCGFDRPAPDDAAAEHAWRGGAGVGLAGAIGVTAGAETVDEAGLADIASSIQQLMVELNAIERERREGSLDSLDLIDRCLTVWFAIQEIGGRIEAAEARG